MTTSSQHPARQQISTTSADSTFIVFPNLIELEARTAKLEDQPPLWRLH
jgi:hypothetical protein